MKTQATPSNQDQHFSAKSIRNGLIAGYSAGFCGIVVGHPLDSIKVLLQTDGGPSLRNNKDSSRGISTATQAPNSSQQAIPKANAAQADTAITRAAAQTISSNGSPNTGKANVSTASVIGPSGEQKAKLASKSITGKRSIRSLYAGASGPLMVVGLLQSINFATYDSVRRTLYQRQLRNEHQNEAIVTGRDDDYLRYDNISNIVASAFVSGSVMSFITSPLIIVKTKQQLMVWGIRKAVEDTYRSGMSSRPHFWKGLKNFYLGFGIHYFCDTCGRTIYFTSYEILKRQLARRNNNGEESHPFNNRAPMRDISLHERMMCAAFAGMSSWAIMFPADVIRSRLYAQSLHNDSSRPAMGALDLARHMVKEQGIGSLYRGLGITVARAGPVAAAVLPVYDSVLAWLSSH